MRLISVFQDSYVFEEPHRKVQGKNRLTIASHGWHKKMPGTVRINNQYRNPEQLAALINEWTSIPDLYNVRLISCKLANPTPEGYRQWERTKTNDPRQHLWSTSFASKLSILLPGVFVRAYFGIITSTCGSKSISALYDLAGGERVKDILIEKFKIFKDSSHHYHCLVFLNGEFVKQTINGNDFKCLYRCDRDNQSQ
ncbi:hypothetical protein [Xenorhabdus bharatensis]|uniref:hypothetical protein n=1 Tax=Xenorhabdus bharatensis TaxID=3136256 RepID=UPI0030F3F69E